MPGTQPHTGTSPAPPAAEQQQLRERLDHEPAAADPTTLKFEGRIAVKDEDAGSDPYNRTGRFRRLVR